MSPHGHVETGSSHNFTNLITNKQNFIPLMQSPALSHE